MSDAHLITEVSMLLLTALQEHSDRFADRHDAIRFYYQEREDIDAAVAAFRAAHPERNKKTAKQFINTWVGNFTERHCLYDKAHTGRPLLISDEEALEASLAFGCDKYTSVAEAMEQSPYIKRLVEEKGVSEQMLRRRMWQVNPRLVLHTPQLKKAMTRSQKTVRLTRAAELLLLTDEQLARVVWMDAKTIWVTPQRLKEKVYGIRGFADQDALRISVDNVCENGVRLKFFTGVTMDKGAVFMFFTSETTDLYPDDIKKLLKVS